MKYYVRVGTENQGPYGTDELRARGLAPSEYVWRDGMADWQPASNLPELAGVLQSAYIASKAAYVGDRTSPYASPVSSSYSNFSSAAAATGALRQSGFGIASTIIGVATFASAFFGLMLIGFLQEQGANAEPTPAMIVLMLGVCLGGPLFHVVGLILGIVGIFQHDRSKLFGIMGTVVNGLMVVGGVAFLAVCMLIGFSVAGR